MYEIALYSYQSYHLCIFSCLKIMSPWQCYSQCVWVARDELICDIFSTFFLTMCPFKTTPFYLFFSVTFDTIAPRHMPTIIIFIFFRSYTSTRRNSPCLLSNLYLYFSLPTTTPINSLKIHFVSFSFFFFIFYF